MSINQSLLDLCVGTHNLYLRRRQPDLLEVQQMRIQTQEQRQRRLAEQCKLQREKESRVAAEMERDRLRAELGHMAEQLNTMQVDIYYGLIVRNVIT
jgi:merlin